VEEDGEKGVVVLFAPFPVNQKLVAQSMIGDLSNLITGGVGRRRRVACGTWPHMAAASESKYVVEPSSSQRERRSDSRRGVTD